MSITKSKLTSVAESVRQEYEDNIHGYCWPASNELMKTYINQFDEIETEDVSIEEVEVGISCRRKHYVVSFPAKYVSDIHTKGRVLIDITLDQYCDELKNNGAVDVSLGPQSQIPSVVIYKTKSESPYI